MIARLGLLVQKIIFCLLTNFKCHLESETVQPYPACVPVCVLEVLVCTRLMSFMHNLASVWRHLRDQDGAFIICVRAR